MRKRIMTVLLVFIILFTMDAETLYAMSSQNDIQRQQGVSENPGEERDTEENDGKIELENPEESVNPQEPEEPSNPENPQNPEEPLNPENPQNPEEPSNPENPQNPEAPSNPENPQEPEEPENSGNPENPQEPEDVQKNVYYTIVFNSDGGSKIESRQVAAGETADQSKVEQPVKKGYRFLNWITEDGKPYDFSQPVTGNLTLKAQWSPIMYKIRFDANQGTGTMKGIEKVLYDQKITLPKNRFTRKGYLFEGWKLETAGTEYPDRSEVKNLVDQDGAAVTLKAVWRPGTYKVRFNRNGGTGSMKDLAFTYGQGKALSSNRYKKKGYTFAGWNTKKDGTGKNYKNKAYVKNITTKNNATVQLYAKWKIVEYKISYVTKGGKMGKSVRKSYKVNTKTFTLPRPTRKGYDFDGWYKDSRYKKRIGEIKKGSAGNLKLYAKWIRCTGKAKIGAAKITYCKAAKTSRVRVKAQIKRRVASQDDYYYLVYMNPNSKKVYKMAAKSYKKKNIAFDLKTTENQGYVTSMFGIAVKKGGKYTLLSTPSYVKNPEKTAKNKSRYKTGSTKKGIQYSNSMEELYACGAKNTFLNVTASMVCHNATIPYKYNGKTYYFNNMDYYRQIVSQCNKNKINVTMQILLDWTDGHTDLIASQARIPGASFFYTWNISSNKSREKMEAMFCYLGMVFGQKNCYTSNWVLGNEVNNPNGWNYKGTMSKNAYFKTYAYCFRVLYYAVRSQYSSAQVFICVDNLWNTSVAGGYSAKTVISSFTKELGKIQKGVKWNLAYHAYSFPLTNTRFWNGFGISYNQNTPYVTMNNLKVLTDYIKRNYGTSVRIILSEQGYSSTSGESQQAAALAYSYYIAACNPMVDSFIIRSYSDHPVEVIQGLSMGISGKEAFAVYKYMDTSKSLRYTNRYLHVIGAGSWKDIVPGYSFSRIKKMYRKI